MWIIWKDLEMGKQVGRIYEGSTGVKYGIWTHGGVWRGYNSLTVGETLKLW